MQGTKVAGGREPGLPPHLARAIDYILSGLILLVLRQFVSGKTFTASMGEASGSGVESQIIKRSVLWMTADLQKLGLAVDKEWDGQGDNTVDI